MWLVLCAPTDIAAIWVYRELKARGLAPIEIITLEVLVRALSWEHRLGADGVSFRIKLANNLVITEANTRGVLNRLTYIDPQLFAVQDDADRLYATQEMTALFMSWLTALRCPVLNRPVAQGLSGSWRHPSEWTVLAAEAGLPTYAYRQTASHPAPEQSSGGMPGVPVQTVFVVEGRTVSHGLSIPPAIAEACSRLAALARVNLLGIELALDNAWTFAGATPQPDLRHGGGGVLDALVSALDGEGRDD